MWCTPILTGQSVLSTERSRKTDYYALALLCLDRRRKIFMRVGLAWIKEQAWYEGCDQVEFLHSLI